MINLTKNAVQAIGQVDGRIDVSAYNSENEAEQIFVPFFTTRPDGNGIGLSLSRQIMKLSGGSISLLRAGTNGWNTTFVLEFE